MGTSLKDIAETLNLSKTTVSWVLSGRADEKGISAATQQRVSRCAQRLNYRPNLLARSLNTGESGMIGLILPSISDSFYSQVAREVEMEVEEHGYSLMICSSESEPERENRMIRLFRAKQVDGLIIAPTVRSGEEIRRLVDESFPFVVFDRRFPKLDTHCVLIDNERSSYALVRRLTEDGFRRIAVITTNSHLETMDARRAGYGRALADAGIAFDESLYGEVEFARIRAELARRARPHFRAGRGRGRVFLYDSYSGAGGFPILPRPGSRHQRRLRAGLYSRGSFHVGARARHACGPDAGRTDRTRVGPYAA